MLFLWTYLFFFLPKNLCLGGFFEMCRYFQVIECLLYHKASAYLNGNKNEKNIYLFYFFQEIHICNVVSVFKKTCV